MKLKNSKDGFGYDLDKALKEGNIFERVFHSYRISPWLNKVDYSGKKVLDIGCNTGILLIPLLEKGVDIIGVDISRSDVAKARKKLREKNLPIERAVVADAKKLPFDSNIFDMIILSDILEHVSQPDLVAKEALRVVKPKGSILATVPNETHPVVKFTWLRKALTGRKNVDEYPDIPYNLEKLVKLFPGVEIVKCKLAGLWVQLFCVFKKTSKQSR